MKGQGFSTGDYFRVIIVAGFAILCSCYIIPQLVGYLIESQFTQDPTKAAAIGQSIIDYELPPGYIEEGGTNFFGTKMVFIIPEDGQGVAIILMQFETGGTHDEQMKEQTEAMFAQQRGKEDIEMTPVDEREIIINSKAVTLTEYEGVDDEGNRVRQYMSVFDALNGNAALFMIRGLEREWDENEVAFFLNSLK